MVGALASGIERIRRSESCVATLLAEAQQICRLAVGGQFWHANARTNLLAALPSLTRLDRKGVGEGKSVDLGGRRLTEEKQPPQGQVVAWLVHWRVALNVSENL